MELAASAAATTAMNRNLLAESRLEYDVLVTYNYINKLISPKPDFRYNSNFAGVVYLVPFTCIPNLRKIHIVLLPSTMKVQ